MKSHLLRAPAGQLSKTLPKRIPPPKSFSFGRTANQTGVLDNIHSCYSPSVTRGNFRVRTDNESSEQF